MRKPAETLAIGSGFAIDALRVTIREEISAMTGNCQWTDVLQAKFHPPI
jgi:hypothetical protein